MIKTVATALLLGLAFFSVARAETDLENSMKRTAKAYHQLVADMKAPVDASKADYVALANTMKTETQKSRDLVPKKIAALPADQQAPMIAAYQKSMDDLSATIDTLITALQAGNWADAHKAIDKIKQQEDEGHKEFRAQKKDDPSAPATPPPAAAPSAAAPTSSSSSSTPTGVPSQPPAAPETNAAPAPAFQQRSE